LIFLVMTADCGMAMATLLHLVPTCAPAAQGFGHLVEFFDLPVGDPALFEGLGSQALQHDQLTGRVFPQLDQLHTGGTDV
jgi:hypothetical protein